MNVVGDENARKWSTEGVSLMPCSPQEVVVEIGADVAGIVGVGGLGGEVFHRKTKDVWIVDADAERSDVEDVEELEEE